MSFTGFASFQRQKGGDEMSRLNHYAISAILGSEIVGRVNAGHGQIASVGDARQYFNRRAAQHAPEPESGDPDIAIGRLRSAFLAAREVFGDTFSTDRYLADLKRNKVFLDKCR